MNLKVALFFPINKFRKHFFKELAYIKLYIMINATNEGICVEF